MRPETPGPATLAEKAEREPGEIMLGIVTRMGEQTVYLPAGTMLASSGSVQLI